MIAAATKMRVAVFGASGVQGYAQVLALAREGHHPVSISRNPKPLQVDGKQIETIASDFYSASVDELKNVLEGCDSIFLNLPSTSFQPFPPLLEATRRIGEATVATPSVKLIVFNTSMPVPDESKGIEAQDHRREMRDLLRSQGIPVISMQPVCFLENLLEGWAWPPIRDESKIIYCHNPKLEAAWICHDDIARLMIAAMERPELAGRNIPIGGPEPVKLSQLAEKLSRAWGRKLDYENQSVQEFSDNITKTFEGKAGIEADVLSEQMFRAYSWYNDAPEKPFTPDMDAVLKELPVRLTTIEEWGRKRNPFA